MRVLLLHLDGKLPNLALMRLAAYHRERGDEVTLRRADNPRLIGRHLDDPREWGRIYGSLIFERTRPLAELARVEYPDIILGGTGWDLRTTLAELDVPDGPIDYSDYPWFRSSIGFTQRGCRLRCGFCVVPRKEGAVQATATIADLWRGEPWPRELVLLDNDFFGQPEWAARIAELRAGRFKVNFNQGINARMLTDETAAAIASVDYRNVDMTNKRLYTAWDNRKDEARLFAGLEALVRHGVKPSAIMVYILIGYWPGETHEDRDYRRRQLREFGAVPYPMPFNRDPAVVAFARWTRGGVDKRIPWDDFMAVRAQISGLPDRRQERLPL